MEEAIKKQLVSLDQQRQAIRRQLENKTSAAFIEPLSPVYEIQYQPVAQADCQALAANRVNQLVSAAARKHSLDPALLRAVMRQESAFRPCALSYRGAEGLMQLMPETARGLHVLDAFNPEQNVQAGAAYLKQLLNRYKGDLRLALVGYNAGPARADQPDGTTYPPETQNYVSSIFAALGLGLPQ